VFQTKGAKCVKPNSVFLYLGRQVGYFRLQRDKVDVQVLNCR